MNRWFMKFAVVLLPSFMVSLAPVNAVYNACDTCCDPCYDSCDVCDGFEYGAEFIFWKPCIDDLDYAIQCDKVVPPSSGNAASCKYRYVEPGWEPGIRGYLNKRDIWCNWDLLASYTYLGVKERDTAREETPGLLKPTLFNPSLIRGSWLQLTSKYKLHYQDFNVLLSYECCMCRGHYVSPFFGLAGVFLDQKVEATGIVITNGNDDSDMKWDSCYWGLGMECGTEYLYCICDGLNFFAKCSGTILTGWSETDRRERFITNIPTSTKTVNFRSDDECLFVNGYHMASGFLYEDCWCDWDYSFRFGYEFRKWTNVLTPRRYINDQAQFLGYSASPSTTTLGFHGIFVGLTVGF